MSQAIANRSVPAATVIPELPYADVVEASDWLCEALGFTVRLRIGSHRAQLAYGEGAVIVMDGGSGEIASQSMLVRVADADAHHERARAAGARIMKPPTDYPSGDGDRRDDPRRVAVPPAFRTGLGVRPEAYARPRVAQAREVSTNGAVASFSRQRSRSSVRRSGSRRAT